LRKLVCVALALAVSACVPIGFRWQNLPYASSAAASSPEIPPAATVRQPG
jgi:hypothetical protein